MSNVTRRGFLSLMAALPVLAKIPEFAEQPVLEPVVIPTGPRIQLMRYSLGLIPDSSLPIEPGRVTILRGRLPIIMRPDKLMLNTSGFNLLHLGMNHEPIFDCEVPSDLFMATSYGMRMEMATLNVAEEVIIAAVNRTKEPLTLIGSLLGSGYCELSEEEWQAQQEAGARIDAEWKERREKRRAELSAQGTTQESLNDMDDDDLFDDEYDDDSYDEEGE